MKKAVCLLLSFWMVLSTAVAMSVPAMAQDTASDNASSFSGNLIAPFTGTVPGYTSTPYVYGYDFEVPDVGYYAYDDAIAMGNRTGAAISDGHLTTQPDREFIFGSAVCLGDDYGIYDGWLSFDLCLTGGNVTLGLRTSMTSAPASARGLWFRFDSGATVRVSEPESGLSASFKLPGRMGGTGKNLTVHDEGDRITLFFNNEPVMIALWYGDGNLILTDKDGSIVTQTAECRFGPTGYFELILNGTADKGYVDNVVFTHTGLIRKDVVGGPVDYSMWTATDALGRTVSDNTACGNPNPNRYVGLFYFLCWSGSNFSVNDHTKQYLELGTNGLKEYFDKGGGGEAYWAEPYFGYYRNTDTWVYRKHGYQLAAAGVDFIFLDCSNANVFTEAHTALFDTWLDMRREGTQTPQIVFFTGDTGSTFESDFRTLITTVYSEDNWDKYKELFFKWKEKPLIFGNLEGVSDEISRILNEKFTVRRSWAWGNEDNYWPWMLEYKGTSSTRGGFRFSAGGWGRDENGKYESLPVCLGHHASASKGRSFVNLSQPNNQLKDYEFSSIEQAGQGLCFAYEYEAAEAMIREKVSDDDPFVLMITGWNEWIAGSFRNDPPEICCNTPSSVSYVDNFNAEFSRDAEPMRNSNGYGFGDNYYYQMTDIIRRYKGFAATPAVDAQTTVNIYNANGFDAINTVFRDHVGDTELRNEATYDRSYRYINNTGRNDLYEAKVSQDSDALYFRITCTEDIVTDTGNTWMNLFVDSDNDPSTGWNGYDFVLNRQRDAFSVSVDRLNVSVNGITAETVGGAYYYLFGQTLQLAVSKSVLGIDGTVNEMVFKWADNSVDPVENGDPMGFMDLGDTAPDGRFGFRYKCTDCMTDHDIRKQASGILSEAVKRAADREVTVSLVEKPEEMPHSVVSKVQTSNLYDFSTDSANAGVENCFDGLFSTSIGTPWSSAKVVKDSDGNRMAVTGYTDIMTQACIEGPYEFSINAHFVDDNNIAVGIRGEYPRSPYYEWDWYREHGGQNGDSSMCSSGILIMPSSDKINLRIKRYEPDGERVTSARFEFAYPDGCAGFDGWFRIRYVDSGDTVRLYIDDSLLCSIALSRPGTVYAEDMTNQPFFGLATVTDANGTLLGEIENTRVNSAGSQLFIATRDKSMQFTDMTLIFDRNVVSGNRYETVFACDKLSVLSERNLVDSLAFGNVMTPGTQDENNETDGNMTEITETDTVNGSTDADNASDTSSADTLPVTNGSDSGCSSSVAIFTVLFAMTLFPMLVKRKKH